MQWDWKAMDMNLQGDLYRKLEQQIVRMDICHYAYPKNLESLLKAIGKLQPANDFEGCGSCNDKIKDLIKEQLSELNNQFASIKKQSDRESQIKTWLLACLMKTLKAQTGLIAPEIYFTS